VLVDVSSVHLEAAILGRAVSMPVMLAPVAFQRLAHPDGEMATARAAATSNTIAVLSTSSTTSIEDVATTGAALWFQLYVQRDRGVTEELIRRAEAAGYGALVLTVDAPMLGRRERDERNRFSLPPGIGLANFGGRALPPAEGSGVAAYSLAQTDDSLTWDDLEWLRSRSSLPLVLKGILRADDATRAAGAGVSAIVVSNHGGRQLDGSIPSVHALPDIVDAVGERVEVYLDGGIRRGVDVLRALALGARAVLLGRPIVWGLAVAGEAGVARMLAMVRDELALAMSLAGTPSVRDIGRSLLAEAEAPRPPYA
jgi:4-hydroxymandelate oxidase